MILILLEDVQNRQELHVKLNSLHFQDAVKNISEIKSHPNNIQISSPTNSIPTIQDTPTDVNEEITCYIHRHLPTRSPKTYVSPFDFACFVENHVNFKVKGERISKLTLLKFMIKKKYIPCKLTSCYKILKSYRVGDLPENVTWSELERHGRKPYLS